MLLLMLACTASPSPDTGTGSDGTTGTAVAQPWGDDLTVPDGPDVPVSGYALNFGPPWGGVVDAEITVVELPEHSVRTDADGRFDLGALPRGELLSFELSHPDQAPIRTATFLLGHPDDGGDAITDLAFQAPTHDLYTLMAQATGEDPDAELCQVATTVTRREHDMITGSGSHGEPGATATMDPDGTWAAGPIYFNMVDVNLIWPDPALTETTHDGGVVWTNVEPGDYLMQGHKDGASLRPVKVRCAAGYLINAAPPWGLQVLSGGLDPDDPGYED